MSSISDISAATNPATASTGASNTDKSNSSLSGDFTQFLKLLTTQLQNQDPTSPMETNEFTNQIIGFSEVEQSVNTNSKLDKLVASQTASTTSVQLTSAVNYIGKMVEAEGELFQVKAGEEPQFSYKLEDGVRQSTITIYNSEGQAVGSFQGKGEAGKYNIVWDAKDAEGNRVPPGNYIVKVTSLDDAGKSSAATTYVLGEVTGVELKDGEAKLRIDDQYLVPLADVQSVAGKPIISEETSDDESNAA